ncbi:unnamed protein product [Phaeothamnion confervicola]
MHGWSTCCGCRGRRWRCCTAITGCWAGLGIRVGPTGPSGPSSASAASCATLPTQPRRRRRADRPRWQRRQLRRWRPALPAAVPGTSGRAWGEAGRRHPLTNSRDTTASCRRRRRRLRWRPWRPGHTGACLHPARVHGADRGTARAVAGSSARSPAAVSRAGRGLSQNAS